MRSSYAIVWREGDGPPQPGSLELLPRTLRLESGSNGHSQTVELPYDDLDTITLEHGNGSGSHVAVGRLSGPPIIVTAFAQPGLLAELADRLASAHLRTGSDSVLVLLPVRPERRAEVRALVAQGPPFDPGEVGLDRHEVFLTDEEVAFVFDAPERARALDRMLEDPALWEAAAEWEHVLAGPPRVAEHGYSWSRERGFTTPPLPPPIGLGF
jgi:hypothetical protein